MDRDVDVVIIGAGFAGIGMAIECGRRRLSYAVVDKAPRPGGVWRDNTYPGAACDVPSHLYSFSFAPRRWGSRYAPQAEILDYIDSLVERYHIAAHLFLGAGVTRAAWVAATSRWHLTLSDGSSITARHAVSAVGQLHQPAYPGVPGRDRFSGPSWHSAEWWRATPLEGRVVGVIGTGASAVQLVPEVARQARHTVVFQRSAPYVLPRGDHAYAGSGGGLLRHAPARARLDRLRTFGLGELLTAGYVASPRLRAQVARRCQAHLDDQVADIDLRARLQPDYEVGCKRICFSDDWYPALCRPDVELVTEPVGSITPAGVRTTSGGERALDVLIYATGFASTRFLEPMEVVGAGGQRLADAWAAGAEAYLGLAVSGFPNFWVLYGPNTNLGANSILYMLESQIRYVGEALRLSGTGRPLTVRSDVQRRWSRWIATASEHTTYRSGCHSWYTDTSGRNTNNWPTFTYRYRRRLSRLDPADYTRVAVGTE